MAPRVVVLGAGICGLSSAVCIQQACPLARVEIVSEHFSPDTTSDASAGWWEPYLLGSGSDETGKRFSEETYEYLLRLAHSPLAGVVKVQKLSGYHLYKNRPREKESWKDTVEGFRILNKKDMEQFPNADTGTFHTTVSVDVPAYMTWLMKRFVEQGGKVRQAKIESIEEIGTDCDILINCSALSSKYLFNDTEIYPIRGQVWKVKAPWVKHFYLLHEKNKRTAYVLPGVDYITVGGTSQEGDWNTQPDADDGADIWERALHHFPMLRNVTPLKSVAGLRPFRKTLRVESETVNVHGRKLKVIHNYGHGGSGITLHWGCALEVTKLLMEALGTEPDEARRLVSRL